MKKNNNAKIFLGNGKLLKLTSIMENCLNTRSTNLYALGDNYVEIEKLLKNTLEKCTEKSDINYS